MTYYELKQWLGLEAQVQTEDRSIDVPGECQVNIEDIVASSFWSEDNLFDSI